MAEVKAPTQKEMFARIAEVCAEDAEIVAFCEHKIEQLSKPRKRKSNPEVEEFRAAVATFLAEQDAPITNKEAAAALEVSAQKSASALNFLVKEGKAVAELEGKTKFYSIA